MESASNIVEIRNICKSYRRGEHTIAVLNDISFDIARGEFLAIMGPSGSGKSTLLNLIAGIDRADSGSIVVNDEDITALSESELAGWRADNVGFIFQFYNLIPVLTAAENIDLPLHLTGLTRAQRREHVEAALEMVNLTARSGFEAMVKTSTTAAAAEFGRGSKEHKAVTAAWKEVGF